MKSFFVFISILLSVTAVVLSLITLRRSDV
jgi:hypothetical protein